MSYNTHIQYNLYIIVQLYTEEVHPSFTTYNMYMYMYMYMYSCTCSTGRPPLSLLALWFL